MSSQFMSQSISRRQFGLGVVALSATTFLAEHASVARAAEMAPDFSAMGYPELAVTISDAGFEGVPESIAAGRYRLMLTNQLADDSGNTGAVAFLSPTPVGMTAADFLKAMGGSGEPSPDASPAADTSGDQGGGDEEIPLIFYQMYFAGGAFALAGMSAEVVIDLIPGEYVVWGDDPTVAIQPVIVNVTGDMPQDLAEPEVDLTATLVDFGITIEGNLAPGSHLIRVQNVGAEPHFLEIDRGPDSMTNELVMSALTADPLASPEADGFSEQDLQPVFFSPTQSIGTVTFQHIELTEGTFLAACFFPTAGTGVPHAMNGMVDVFTVDGGAMGATPTS